MAEVIMTTEDLRLMIELVNDKIVEINDGFTLNHEKLVELQKLEKLQNKLYDIAEME